VFPYPQPGDAGGSRSAPAPGNTPGNIPPQVTFSRLGPRVWVFKFFKRVASGTGAYLHDGNLWIGYMARKLWPRIGLQCDVLWDACSAL